VKRTTFSFGWARSFVFRLGLLAPLASVLFLVPDAWATATSPVVYHSPSDDGQRPGSPPLQPPGGNFVLHLYMDEGDGSATASQSNPCGGGDGDERCGWDLAIEASGLVDFVSFSESGDVIAGLTSGPSPLLRFNGGSPGAGELGSIKLGDLEISSTGNGSVFLSSGTVVSSAQARVTLPVSELIELPEPAIGLSLAAGAAFLAAMNHRRRRRCATNGLER
jgi:hypothetical protein